MRSQVEVQPLKAEGLSAADKDEKAKLLRGSL